MKNQKTDQADFNRLLHLRALALTFAMILPSFGYTRLTDLDVPSSVIFIFFTAYAIVQYKWMNIKMVAVEIISVSVCSLALMEILYAKTLEERFYKSFYFLILVTISAFQVRRVLNKHRGGLRGISDVG